MKIQKHYLMIPTIAALALLIWMMPPRQAPAMAISPNRMQQPIVPPHCVEFGRSRYFGRIGRPRIHYGPMIQGTKFWDYDWEMTVLPLYVGDWLYEGDWLYGGYVEGYSRHQIRHQVRIHDSALRFQYLLPWNNVTFEVWDPVGILNLQVNGDLRRAESMLEFHGKVVGGVAVQVHFNQDNQRATVSLDGRIESVVIGGEGLWLGPVCPMPHGGTPTNTPTVVTTPRPTSTHTNTPTATPTHTPTPTITNTPIPPETAPPGKEVP